MIYSCIRFWGVFHSILYFYSAYFCNWRLILPESSSEMSIANMFCKFFSEKIERIRKGFSKCCQIENSDAVPEQMLTFQEVNTDYVTKLILKSPTKSCSLDPWPTTLLKECVDIVAPSITKLVNLSLLNGVVPESFKKAIVTPLIKKASLPKNDPKNYRPVSGLPFISKLVERVSNHWPY